MSTRSGINISLDVEPVTLQRCDTQQDVKMTQRDQKSSRLLSLPAELRNMVYEHVFQGWAIAIRPSFRRYDSLDADIYPATASSYHTVGKDRNYRADRPSNLLSLLYICRQIRAEARLLPYSLNTFFYGEGSFPYVWMDILHEQLAQVRVLQLCSHKPANITLSRIWLEMLAWFTGLEKIEIFWHLRMPSWGQEEDNLATATRDETEMMKKIKEVTRATCNVVFHRFVIRE